MAMHRYFIKTPWLVKKLFPSYVWSMPAGDHSLYLSFDDGPHPEITPWVLDELKKYNAKASFFCIGKNVEQYPGIYQRILDEGHATGNHSYSHLNGWHTPDEKYIDDVATAATIFRSSLFRPPYGRIRSGQAKKISGALGSAETRIIMWDVLSGDFDTSFSREACFRNVADNAGAGSIIVFHDSEKAFHNLEFALPATLLYFSKKGFDFRKID